MASRWWVGGTGNWNDTAHWANSSGGPGGKAVPTAGDDAYFDGNSGGGTCTINIAADPDNIYMQVGYTGTITQSANPNVGSLIDVLAGTWATAGYNVDCGSLNIGAGGTWTSSANSIITADTGNITVASGATVTWASGRLRFTNTGANQSLTCDPTDATIYELYCENFGYDVVMQTDIRVTNHLWVQRSGSTNAHLDVNGNDIYLRGSGTLLTLDGNFRDATTSKVVYEINAGGTSYIEGSTGWQPAGGGGMTGIQIWIQVIATVTATIRLTADIQDVNAFIIESTAAGSGATVTFYTDNYNFRSGTTGRGIYSFIRVGPELAADACAFTSYWGSSVVIWDRNSFIRWQWDAATHNLQSAQFRGRDSGDTDWGGTYSVYGPSTGAVDTAQTFNAGTSLIQVANIGETWMGLGAHDGVATAYDIVLWNLGGTAYCYIKTVATHKLSLGDNGSTQETNVQCQAIIDVGELELDALYDDVVFEFYEVGTNVVSQPFDFSGSGSYRVRLRLRTIDSGTTDGTATNKLIDSTQNFTSTVSIGDKVRNDTDDTEALVTNVDSDTQLTLDDDIMTSGESYRIVSATAATVSLGTQSTVTRTDVQDNNLTGQIADATDPTNIDSGNNSAKWVFVLVTGVDRAVLAGVERGVLIGTA